MSERLTPDELDRLIDGLLQGADDTSDAEASRHRYALLSAARRIRALADEPVPAEIRNRHLATIRRAAAERSAPTPAAADGSNWLLGLRRRAAAVAAATGLVFTATGGGAVALAQDATPDDALYGVKRLSENVALAVTSDDAQLHLQFAERRLEELEAAPDHAAELAPQAAEHLNHAQAHGASADDAGAAAVARLSTVLDQLSQNTEVNENALSAVSRACQRIAERHGHDGPDAPDCGDAEDPPGRSGENPGNSGEAPGRSGEAPRGGPDTTDADEGARPDGAGPPEGVPAPGSDDG